LKETATVMDTAPVKEKVAGWAKRYLPPGRSYVGLTPVLSSAYLHAHDTGIDAAHADLFRGGMMVIVAPPDAPSGAIKLAADLSRLLGAESLFADPLEVDSLMAATHILPQLLAVSLLNITVDQPGWRERSRLAGRAFAEVTAPVVNMGSSEALGSAALLAGENLVRLTDSAIAALQALRNDIKHNDRLALTEKLERARCGRETWWQDRQAIDGDVAPVEPPESSHSSDMFTRLLGLGKRISPKNPD
jgi:prephenate dehydrogenase